MVIKKIIKVAAKRGLKSKSKARKVRSHPKPKVKSKATIERDRNQKKFVAMHKKVQAKRKPRFNPMAKKNQPTGSVTRNMSVDGTPIYERYEPTGLGSFGATMGGRYKSGEKFGKIKPKSVRRETMSDGKSNWWTNRGANTVPVAVYDKMSLRTKLGFNPMIADRTDVALFGTAGAGIAALPPLFGIQADQKNKNEREAKRISDLKKGQRNLKAEQKAYEDELRGEPGPYSAYPSP